GPYFASAGYTIAMARSTRAQKARGCARYTSMACPLPKVVHSSLFPPAPLWIVPYPPLPVPNRHGRGDGRAGLCVKNTSVGKGVAASGRMKGKFANGIKIQAN